MLIEISANVLACLCCAQVVTPTAIASAGMGTVQARHQDDCNGRLQCCSLADQAPVLSGVPVAQGNDGYIAVLPGVPVAAGTNLNDDNGTVPRILMGVPISANGLPRSLAFDRTQIVYGLPIAAVSPPQASRLPFVSKIMQPTIRTSPQQRLQYRNTQAADKALQREQRLAQRRSAYARRQAAETQATRAARLAKRRSYARERRIRRQEQQPTTASVASAAAVCLATAVEKVRELVCNPDVDVNSWTAPPGGVASDLAFA